jgi:16S rRNA (cytosine967-C5)-methyltransferase
MQVQLQAARTLLQVFAGRSLSAVLPQARAQGSSAAESGAVQDLAFGVLRHLGLLRALLGELTDRRVEDADLETLLLVALYQLQFTRTPPHAVVDQSVRACTALRKRSAGGLTNAVLRNFLRRRESIVERACSTETGRWSYPQWWIDALRLAYPSQFSDILASGNARPPMTLRVNLRRMDCDAYQVMLQQAGIEAEQVGPGALLLERPVPIARLPGFTAGLASVQDLSAQYAVPLMDLAPGQRVLDACAAPGGKTAHIAEICNVELTAIDRDAQRLTLVAQTFERLQLSPIKLLHADAGELNAWWDGVPFDRILLDAPCTASGIVRRHPDIKWLRRPTDIANLAAEQQALLRALWRALTPGGKLLYATCSVFPEETQLQLSAFLHAHADARLLKLPAIAEIANTQGQILPDSRHDGFFYALLQKD